MNTVNSQNASQQKSIISHLVIIAGLSKFVINLKKTLFLTNEYIKSALSKSKNSTKEALRSNLIIMQNRKWALDELENISQTVAKISEAENLNMQLQKEQIHLNIPTPDFDNMKKSLNTQRVKLTNFTKELDKYENEQNQLNDKFIKDCKTFKKDIESLYKESNIEFSTKEFSKNVSDIME